MKFSSLLSLFLFACPFNSYAVEYNCVVTKKINQKHEYNKQELAKWKFSVLLKEEENRAYLSRCSYTMSAGKVTCDNYEVDKISHDTNVKIKKYYVFRSHFDVQLFSDLSFIENNGRGGIAFGECIISSP